MNVKTRRNKSFKYINKDKRHKSFSRSLSKNKKKIINNPNWYNEEKKLVGDFIKFDKFGIVELDGNIKAPNIYIDGKYTLGAKTNEKVVIEIINFNSKSNKKPEGKVVKILGEKNKKGIDIEGIINEYNNSYTFSNKELDDAKKLNIKLNLNEELKNRQNLTKLYTFTIDGVDSKDLDDAISIEKKNDLFILYVHIADVSSYIEAGSRLDTKAYERGTSIYLLDRVVPMFPFDISNGICSLNEGENRRTLTCKMVINDNGDIIDYEIIKAVINSDRKLNYDYVTKIAYNKNKTLRQKDALLAKKLDILVKLVKILKRKRLDNGMLEFSFDEPGIILDSNNIPREIFINKRVEAYELIEHLMLCANETVAKYAKDNNIPFIYRNHEKPIEEKIEELKSILSYYNIKSDFHDEIEPKSIQNLIKKVDKLEYKNIFELLILKTLSQAKYEDSCKGHFGLASNCYCHFTSPIRRYPDLQIHRIITEKLDGTLNDRKIYKYNNSLNLKSLYLSKREREAIATERAVFKLKSVEYMNSFKEKVFDAKIVSLAEYGIYVRLDNLVEGLVPYSLIKSDEYIYDENKPYVKGKKTKRIYMLGDKIKVKVFKADKKNRILDFEILENESNR